MIKADMHLHSKLSDGSLSPEELEDLLYSRGIGFASITDHDTVSSFSGTGKVRFVSGMELSTFSGESEIHLLGYGYDTESPDLIKLMSEISLTRQERFARMVKKAREIGLLHGDIPERFKDLRIPGRYHMACVLIEAGAAGTFREVFSRYLGDGCPLYEPVRYLDVLSGLKALKHAGAFVSFAHPQRTNKDELIKSLVANGLDGIEVFYPFHDAVIRRHYLNLAKKYHIMCTGGSDYHKGVYSYEMYTKDISRFINRFFD